LQVVGHEYPPGLVERKHGPAGYRTYASYLDWLRDEFVFRCVYCLHREQWYGRATSFAIDHLVPVSERTERENDYFNLVYSCSTCNSAKNDILDLPDPSVVSYRDCLRAELDGRVLALNDEGKKLCGALRMNSDSNIAYRHRWIRILTALKSTHPQDFTSLMGFPADLPDLRPPKRRVPSNSIPDGALNCFFVQREFGTLPKAY